MKASKLLLCLLTLALLLTVISCQGTEEDDPLPTTTAAETAPEENLPYTALLHYEYTHQAGYYSCMYVTPTAVTVWNSETQPNAAAPTESEGFDTALTESIPAARYREVAQTAVTARFEESADILQTSTKVSSLEAPQSYIAVYDQNGLCKKVSGIGVLLDSSPASEAFRTLHTALHTLRNRLSFMDGMQTDADIPRTTAILRYSIGGLFGCHAEYYTAERVYTWQSERAPSLHAPLPTAAEITVTEHPGNPAMLQQFEGFTPLEYLPFRMYTMDQHVEDDPFQVIVFYREDGSTRVLASESSYDDSMLRQQILAMIESYWTTPE